MHTPYDQKLEAVDLLRDLPAWAVVERLGLSVAPRTVQRWAVEVCGVKPTRKRLQRRDPIREVVVNLMVASGLDERYCYRCQSRGLHPCLIRALRRDGQLGSLAFICRPCSAPGDV